MATNRDSNGKGRDRTRPQQQWLPILNMRRGPSSLVVAQPSFCCNTAAAATAAGTPPAAAASYVLDYTDSTASQPWVSKHLPC